MVTFNPSYLSEIQLKNNLGIKDNLMNIEKVCIIDNIKTMVNYISEVNVVLN